jgi:anti-anti-sigma factor
MLSARIESKHLHSALWLVVLHGEHDLATSPSLDATLDHIQRTTGTTVVIDLSPAEFIDSTVLRAIVKYDAAGEEIVLVAPQGSFSRRLLRMLGIDERIPLHDSRDDALRAVAAARTRPSRRDKSTENDSHP